MRYSRMYAAILLFGVCWFSSCKKDASESGQTAGSGTFVSATAAGSFTSTALQVLAANAGYRSFVPFLKYNVDYFRFTYNTSYKGKVIEASGLVGIPKNMTTTPSLLSAQHGTLFNDKEAPSNFPNTFTGYELFASAGFITLIPDYIGYGVSKEVVHPFYDQQHAAAAVVDMAEAAKQYLQKQNIAVSNRLFLVGYSEGGYVSMAAQKEMETNADHHLTLTAAAEGAGGYDLQSLLYSIAAASSYSTPSFLAMVIESYNATYDWSRPETDFFQQPYAGQIPTLLNGSKYEAEIDATLPKSPAALFNPVFYAGLANPSGEAALKQAIQQNSFAGWVPKSPTRLYQGTADSVIFYQSTESVYNRFRAAGATNVTFVPIQNGTHDTSVEPMMLDALPWIQSLDK